MAMTYVGHASANLICQSEDLNRFLGNVYDVYELAGASPIHTKLEEIEIEVMDLSMGSVVPAAWQDIDGRKMVGIPQSLPTFVCNYVLVVIFSFNNKQDMTLGKIADQFLMPSQIQMEQCANDSSKLTSECLMQHSLSLGASIGQYIENWTEKQIEELSKSAYSQTRDAIAGLILHEIGHHVLNHFSRISRSEISSREAEFEADRYAVRTLLANGISLSGYSNFFNSLAQSEVSSGLSSSHIYETPFCRFVYARYIDGNKGIVGSFLLNWTIFGSTSHTTTSFSDLFSLIEEEIKSYREPWTTHKCKLPSKNRMIEMSFEMISLLNILSKYSDILFSHSQVVKSFPIMPRGSKNAIIELAKMMDGQGQLGAFKARLTMMFLRRHLRSGGIDRLSKDEIEKVLSKISEYGLVEDVRVADAYLAELK